MFSNPNRVQILKRFTVYIALICQFLLFLWISGCKQKHICPAYQSAFYLDKKTADLEFTPFDKDSMPRMEATVRKTDVLLVLRLGKKKIDKRMAVIPMITIFPEQADSALAMADSMAADSSEIEEEIPKEEGEGISDSSEVEKIEEGQESIEEPPADSENLAEEGETPAPIEKQKTVKKVDLRDPELSDPNLKAEFEESFDDAPKEEDLEEPAFEEPPPVEDKKKKVPKKAGNKGEPLKPKEPEPPAEEDKF